MATLGIGRKLDFVDGEKFDWHRKRHGFDGANPIADPGRYDALLAGHEGDLIARTQRCQTIEYLASQEAQRQPNHPTAVAHHALDREVGFPGIRWSEDGNDGG
jgi:hypothetical protein